MSLAGSMIGSPDPRDRSAIAAIPVVALGATVAIWGVAYVGRLPAVMLPSPVLFFLVLAVLGASGRELRRRVGGSCWRAAWVGPLVLVLHFLVLAAAGPEALAGGDGVEGSWPPLVAWLPVALVGAALLSGLSARFGRPATGGSSSESPETFQSGSPTGRFDPTSSSARLAVVASLLHLGSGAFEGTFAAGVRAWPEPTSSTAPLLPLSTLVGPFLYRDASRPLLALALLATVELLAILELYDRRPAGRWLGRVAALLLLARILVGPLFTASPIWPRLVAEAALDHLHFALLAVLVIATAPGSEERRARGPAGGGERLLAGVLLLLLLVQLCLGVVQRQVKGLLPVHMLLGGTLVLAVAVRVGIRTWILGSGPGSERRLGLLLLLAVAAQVALGLVAFAVPVVPGWSWPPVVDVTLTTVHQWLGALLFALAVLLSRPPTLLRRRSRRRR